VSKCVLMSMKVCDLSIVCVDCRKARAFTLLELFLVLTVIISLAAIIWPSLGGVTKMSQLKYSARELVMLLNLARNGAMAEGCRYRCVFRYEGKKALIEYEADALSQAENFKELKSHWAVLDLGKNNIRCVDVELDEWENLLREQEGEIVERNEQVSSEFSPIMFYPDGQSDSATIVLCDEENNIVSVNYNGLTGEANVVEGNILEENEKLTER